MASTGLSKTFSSSPTNNKKGTMSFWMKKSAVSSGQQAGLLVAGASGGTAGLYFDGDGKLYWYLAYTGSWQGSYTTNRQFRDPNSWYHIVQSWDTTQSTESERMKLYVNGVQETSFSSISYPPQNQVTTFGNATAHYINYWGNASYFDGSMSHFHYTDGYAYAASDFGSFDSTTGEWKINTNPNVTYGTNGFWILKDGMSLTDASPNSNDWAVSTGTLTKTEDNPSNVFATINPIDNYYNNLTITNGSTSWVSTSPYSVTRSTLGASSGKYYFEMKVVNEGNTDYEFGIVGAAATSISSWMGSSGSYGYAYESNGELRANGTTVDPWGSTYDDGDILGCAFDLDNNKIYFSKNGSWQESGDPSSGSNGYTIIAAADTPAGAYFVGAGDFSGSAGQSGQFNFGNGYFGTTAISSEGTNASGLGKFEYDVPTGFTALCTKGLNL